jgi:hypothetical protein
MLEEEEKAIVAASQPSLRSPNVHASTTSNQLESNSPAGRRRHLALFFSK